MRCCIMFATLTGDLHMSDADYIEQAYSESIKQVFKVFFHALANAGSDTQKEEVAERAFKVGVVLARKVRDKALEILP